MWRDPVGRMRVASVDRRDVPRRLLEVVMPAPSPEQSYYQAMLALEGTRPGFFGLGIRGWLGTVGVAFGAILVGVTILQVTTMPAVGLIVVGMGLGSVFRDVGYRRRYIATWPMLDAVIAWDVVRARSGGSDDESASPGGQGTVS